MYREKEKTRIFYWIARAVGVLTLVVLCIPPVLVSFTVMYFTVFVYVSFFQILTKFGAETSPDGSAVFQHYIYPFLDFLFFAIHFPLALVRSMRTFEFFSLSDFWLQQRVQH